MVSPLLLSRGLRKEENNEKKRKRVKRNEIQCMILLKSLIFGSTKSEFCLKIEYVLKLLRNDKYSDHPGRLKNQAYIEDLLNKNLYENTNEYWID